MGDGRGERGSLVLGLADLQVRPSSIAMRIRSEVRVTPSFALIWVQVFATVL